MVDMESSLAEGLVLEAVDALTDTMIGETSTLVRIPSVSGTAAENDAQLHV
ncbi:MAG: hypothetical protein JWN39_3081, partial [Ilumatobacteraceae bacterium]|nr:hypothetical protein [Ilumatobacteraceae bacterium]